MQTSASYNTNRLLQLCPGPIYGDSLDTDQQADPRNDPFSGLLLGLQVEGPHERGTSSTCLIDRALIDILCLLLVDRDGSDEDNRHGRGQFLQSRFLHETGLGVPASTLHEKPVDVCPFSRRTVEVLTVLLGDITL